MFLEASVCSQGGGGVGSAYKEEEGSVSEGEGGLYPRGGSASEGGSARPPPIYTDILWRPQQRSVRMLLECMDKWRCNQKTKEFVQ